MNETKEFPQGKENYCPRCYFENEKVGRRLDCPHQRESFTTPQGTKNWRERFNEEFGNAGDMGTFAVLDEENVKRFITSELSQQAQEFEEMIEGIINGHNAEILNEFQLQGKPDMPMIAYDERVCLLPAMEIATKKTLSSLLSKLKQKYGTDN